MLRCGGLVLSVNEHAALLSSKWNVLPLACIRVRSHVLALSLTLLVSPIVVRSRTRGGTCPCGSTPHMGKLLSCLLLTARGFNGHFSAAGRQKRNRPRNGGKEPLACVRVCFWEIRAGCMYVRCGLDAYAYVCLAAFLGTGGALTVATGLDESRTLFFAALRGSHTARTTL